MAVYTEVSFDEASTLLHALQLGTLQSMQGCASGIENTNYFVDTDQGRFVLTLFERLSHAQLPFYLRLMKHLASNGIAVPDPAADQMGEVVHTLCGKPAAVVNRLRGGCELAPTSAHCAQVGQTLARMHLAGSDFAMQQPHLRGLAWWNSTAPQVLPFLDTEQSALLRSELAYQNHIASLAAYCALPRGAIHADLFRDNVMFEDSHPTNSSSSSTEITTGAPRLVLSGFFDFYFAGIDTWLFDVAVCLNDWCVDLPSGEADPERSHAFLSAYQSVRPLQAAERQLLGAMSRAAALRFWLSRLWDLHLPRQASMLKAHDPTHFERVLRHRVHHPQGLP